MKLQDCQFPHGAVKSPSARREWIEILTSARQSATGVRLPPRGGSGLKFELLNQRQRDSGSPSARREWIEIGISVGVLGDRVVSLREEGVD